MNVPVTNTGSQKLPHYETKGSAGLDIRANLDAPVTLQPMERALIPTGLSFALPVGYEAQIRPRSGLALKRGLTLVNTPGTIDSDYRGEVKIIMINLDTQAQTIENGERVAQMVIARYEQITWQLVDSLDATDRGAGGFGSTGV